MAEDKQDEINDERVEDEQRVDDPTSPEAVMPFLKGLTEVMQESNRRVTEQIGKELDQQTTEEEQMKIAYETINKGDSGPLLRNIDKFSIENQKLLVRHIVSTRDRGYILVLMHIKDLPWLDHDEFITEVLTKKKFNYLIDPVPWKDIKLDDPEAVMMIGYRIFETEIKQYERDIWNDGKSQKKERKFSDMTAIARNCGQIDPQSLMKRLMEEDICDGRAALSYLDAAETWGNDVAMYLIEKKSLFHWTIIEKFPDLDHSVLIAKYIEKNWIQQLSDALNKGKLHGLSNKDALALMKAGAIDLVERNLDKFQEFGKAEFRVYKIRYGNVSGAVEQLSSVLPGFLRRRRKGKK